MGGRPASVARRPRHRVTAEVLGRRIVGGSLAPGSVLPNADLLAREFKVSRPALREAIKFLAGKGLLDMAPRRGTVVRARALWNRLDDDVLTWEMGEAPNALFVRNLFELRRMIEPEAAALAARRATPEGVAAIGAALDAMAHATFRSPDSVRADLDFHRTLLTHSGNDVLATFAPAIETSLTIAFRMQRRTEQHGFLADHARVFHAIRDRNPEAAREAVLHLLGPSEDEALAGLAGVEPTPGVDAAPPSPPSPRQRLTGASTM